MDLVIAVDDPRADDVRRLLEQHLSFARDTTPVEHIHAMAIDELCDPSVQLFSARADRVVVGVGALKRLDDAHAELKSMHTSAAFRRNGVGRALVEHLLAVARARGYRSVSLETGAMDEFAPAHALYSSLGFVRCEPFGKYTVNPYSICMTKTVDPKATSS